MHRGIMPAEGEDLPNLEDDSGLLQEIPRGSIRLQQIRDAIEALMNRNSRGDFTASGQPQLKAIKNVVGYPVDVSEVQRVWHVMQMDKAESQIADADDATRVDVPMKPEDPEELHQAVIEACESVMENGSEEDFKADGSPQVRAVENRLGYQISAIDRDTAYQQLERKRVVR